MDEAKKADLLSRMIPELEGLVEKFAKLDQFILSEAYTKLPAEDRMDLTTQWRAMNDYAAILKIRIEKLNGK